MLSRLYSNTMQCFKSRSSTCRLLLPFSQANHSLSFAGFKTSQPTAPTPHAPNDDPASSHTTHKAPTPRSASSDEHIISNLPPPHTKIHTIRDEDSTYTTIETPTSIAWTKITYLAAPTWSEEIVKAERSQWDPLHKRVEEWGGEATGYGEGKAKMRDAKA